MAEGCNAKEMIEKLQLKNEEKTKELERLRKMLKDLQKKQVLITNSNWKMELSLLSLQKENKFLESEIERKNQSLVNIENKIQQSKSENEKELREFDEFFDSESSYYRNLLSNAKKEYDPENLKVDIENYRKQEPVLKQTKIMIDTEMDELKKKFGVREDESTEKSRLVGKIAAVVKSVKENNLRGSATIKSLQNEKRKLQIKVEQKEHALAEAMKKKQQNP